MSNLCNSGNNVPTTLNGVVPGTGTSPENPPVYYFGAPLCGGDVPPPYCVAGPVGADTDPDTSKKFNNQDTQSWRAQVRIQPNDKLDINIAFDGFKNNLSS